MDLDPDHDVPDDTSDDTNHAPSDTDSDDETTSYGVIMEDESFGVSLKVTMQSQMT